MKAILIRLNTNDKATNGVLNVYDEVLKKNVFKCYTVEREWADNKVSVSCIPEGTYQVEKTYSPRFKSDLYLVKNVPNRSGIRFHSANFSRQLNGCIALGEKPIDIDGDGVLDVTSSRQTHKEFDKIMNNEPFELIIYNWF